MNVLMEERKTNSFNFCKTKDTRNLEINVGVYSLYDEYVGGILWSESLEKFTLFVSDEPMRFDEESLRELADYIKELTEEREAQQNE